ncbi:SusC/RagA family TonB-linked outer membrane protein [Flavitalea sp.]|nr:SusC/RagA family TonB-linked outer membrane protein [Flavitalea sp.]
MKKIACRISRWQILPLNPRVLIFTVFAMTVLSMTFNDLNAQQVNPPIKGKVIDEAGKPLQGVTVKVKGDKAVVTTNELGEFNISLPEKGNKILEISYVGMEPQEVKAGDQQNLIVSLAPASGGEQEVVVVGYGTQRKQAVTGAVVQADLKTYEKVPVNNIMETLKGTVAGLNVGEANTAGGVPGFTIRGTNTIAASTAPLIVLDGVIFSGSMADIAPSDIESVTVLKDASAAAVFGSRSANGVILIESKKGKSVNGKPKFEINANYSSINELQRLKVYDAKGYMQHLYDVLIDNGTNLTFDQTPNFLQTIEKENYNATPDHAPTLADPYGPFRRTGSNLNATVSVSQRTDKMNYYLSGSMVDQKGVIINDDFKHYSLRLNLESKVTSWLTLGVRSYYSYRDYPGDRIYGAGAGSSSPALFSPYASLYNADGSYNMYPQTTTSMVNPFLVLATEAYNRTNNLNGILTGTIRVPWVKGLTYTANYSKTLNSSETGSFYAKNTYLGQAPKGSGSRNYSRLTATLFDNIIKYNRTFAGVHNVDLTLLHSNQKNETYGQGASATGFDNDQLGTNRLSAGAIQAVSTSAAENESVGQMARLTYTYNDKYSLTGTVRRDGYSAFSANHKYGNFSSLGANWNITKEKFMENLKFFNFLALRASYGTNGNQSITPYSTLSRISNGYYFYQGDANYTYTQSISTLGNEDLVWESTTGLNFGLDFEILNKRISGSIDAYSTKTNNLAFTLSLPGASGFTTITANAGEIANKGIELNLRSINIQTPSFSWRSEAAFSLNRNKVNHLLGDRDGNGIEDDIVSSNLFIGKSLTSVYNYQVTGMWQQGDKDNGSIMAGFQPGTYKLLDVNNNGKITSDSDRVFLGNTNANFRWSFTNTFTYKGLSLLVYVNSIWGGNGWFINGGNTPWNDGYTNRGDLNHPVFDYWTPTNTNAEFPRLSYVNKATVRAPKYYDRSFIRLQKVALSYEVTKYVKKYGINGLNVSISGDNLATYAPHWIGLDAATGSGLTMTSIPSLRTYSMSLNFNF